MYWQSTGSYLAVKVDRYTKTKKSTYTGFELFRVGEKECPMEVLELDNKSEKIVAFAWEPKGHRFAIIHGARWIGFFHHWGNLTLTILLGGWRTGELPPGGNIPNLLAGAGTQRGVRPAAPGAVKTPSLEC